MIEQRWAEHRKKTVFQAMTCDQPRNVLDPFLMQGSDPLGSEPFLRGRFDSEISMSVARVDDARLKTAKARPASRTVLANAHDATEFLKALAHEARLVILCLLVEGEKTVTELEDLIGLRQAAISQQLARLRAESLVEARRNGRNIYYSLARPEVREIVEALHRAFCPADRRA